MKKRILTILACLLMLINAFAFSACTNSDLEAKIAELETKIEQLEKEKEFLQLGNFALQNKIISEEKVGDFSFTISLSKTSFVLGEDIIIDLTLKSISNEEQDIAVFFLFLPEVPTATVFYNPEFPKYPTYIKLGPNVIIQSRCPLLYFAELPVGSHEVTFVARFYLNYGEPNEELITIRPRPINIILEN